AARPGVDGLGEAPALPPIRVSAGQVAGHLVSAGLGFAGAVGGHEETLPEGGASGQKLHVARIQLPAVRALVRKHGVQLGTAPVLSGSSPRKHRSARLTGGARLFQLCSSLGEVHGWGPFTGVRSNRSRRASTSISLALVAWCSIVSAARTLQACGARGFFITWRMSTALAAPYCRRELIWS